MKKLIIAFFAVLFIFLTTILVIAKSSSFQNTPSWVIQTIVSEVGGKSFIHLTLDKTDLAHLVYWDESNGFIVYVKPTLQGWETKYFDPNSKFPTFRLSSEDIPQIAYGLGGPPHIMFVTMRDGKWANGPVVNFPSESPSIAEDSVGKLHIAFCDARESPPSGPGLGLNYATLNDDNLWQVEQVDSAHCGNTSLIFGNNDVPSIFYFDKTSNSLNHVSIGENGFWMKETVAEGGNNPTAGIGNNNELTVAFISKDGNATIGKYIGRWETESVSPNPVTIPSMVIDQQGNIYVAFCDAQEAGSGQEGKGLTFAAKTLTGWETSLVESLNCNSVSITLNSKENPQIAYLDRSNQSIKYASFQPAPPATETSTIAPLSTPESVPTATPPATSTPNNTVFILIGGGLVLVALIVVIVLVIRKKK